MPYQFYNGQIGIQSEGAIVLTAGQLTDDMLVTVINAGPKLTVTTLGALKTYFLTGIALANLPTSSVGLASGTIWNNEGFLCVA